MQIYKILGANCFLVKDKNELKKYIINLIESKKGGYSVAINAEKIMMYNKNEVMKSVIDNSILPIPDGAGAVLGFKFLYGKKCLKVDLPKLILKIANKNSYKLFILGAKEEVNKKAFEKIKETYPNINLVGRNNGYFKNKSEIIEKLEKTKPDIVMLALGSPKQELFAYELKDKFPNILFIGCGGALDVLAGKVKRAPKFFQENYLEWLYRLIKEPKRIKRQKVLPQFLVKLIIKSLQNNIRKACFDHNPDLYS